MFIAAHTMQGGQPMLVNWALTLTGWGHPERSSALPPVGAGGADTEGNWRAQATMPYFLVLTPW